LIGYTNKWDKLEEFKHMGINLQSSIQPTIDIANKVAKQMQLSMIPTMEIVAPYLKEIEKFKNLNIVNSLVKIEAIKIPNIKIPTLELSFYHKSQVFLAIKSIEKIQTNINVMNNSSIQEIGRIVSVQHESYINIHKLLQKNIISSIVPKNIGSLVQELINKEPLTQQYLRTIHDKPIDVAITEPNVLVEIEVIKSEILESIHEGNQQLNQAIGKLYAFVLAQKDPKVIIFFQKYLLPIILSLVASFLFKYMDLPKEPLLKTKNQEIFLKKQVTLGLKQYIPNPKERVQYRIVNVDKLNIREGQSMKTEVISHLSFADVVQIIKKEKNWTLIKRYNSDNETLIQGWVFTRYLAQIK